MVIKTETCFFSDYKIYPGHGKWVVRKDGKLLAFLNRKCWSLNQQKKKAQRLTWSQQWRRAHKKGGKAAFARKKVKKTGKVYKAIQGLSIEEIKKKQQQKPEHRKDMQADRLREIRDRKKKAKAAEVAKTAGKGAKKDGKKAEKKPALPAGGFVKQTKARRALIVGQR